MATANFNSHILTWLARSSQIVSLRREVIFHKISDFR